MLLEGAIGPEAELNVMPSIAIGDSFEELRRRYPALFERPMLSRSARLGGGAGYELRFDTLGGIVTEVSVRRAGDVPSNQR